MGMALQARCCGLKRDVLGTVRECQEQLRSQGVVVRETDLIRLDWKIREALQRAATG